MTTTETKPWTTMRFVQWLSLADVRPFDSSDAYCFAGIEGEGWIAQGDDEDVFAVLDVLPDNVVAYELYCGSERLLYGAITGKLT